jgi:hypothetical protein
MSLLFTKESKNMTDNYILKYFNTNDKYILKYFYNFFFEKATVFVVYKKLADELRDSYH